MKSGVLITLEGNEGSGKSTHIKLLYAYLKKCGKKVFLTREPGGTAIGDAIRQVLLDNRHKQMTAETETLLYMASRAQLIEEVIKQQLKKGMIVLCDRWMDATVAYQGYGAGVDVKWIKALGKKATQGIEPTLSIFLDLPLEAGMRRAKRRGAADRMEKKALEFHRRVKNGYRMIAKQESKRFKALALNEQDSIETNQLKIRALVNRVV